MLPTVPALQDGNVLCCGMSRGAGSVSLTVSISQEGKEEGVGSVVGVTHMSN